MYKFTHFNQIKIIIVIIVISKVKSKCLKFNTSYTHLVSLRENVKTEWLLKYRVVYELLD